VGGVHWVAPFWGTPLVSFFFIVDKDCYGGGWGGHYLVGTGLLSYPLLAGYSFLFSKPNSWWVRGEGFSPRVCFPFPNLPFRKGR